eukprot:XP_001700537.1 predicted protein [Chlamydomonas reinhardtii]
MALVDLRAALESLLGPARAGRFTDADLNLLLEGGYATQDDLKDASHTGLQRAGLKPARADQIIHAQAAASQLLTEVSCSNVVRLVDADETVGSCCLVSFNGRNFVLAARHCMNPKAGQRINHDVTVLLLDGGGTAGLPDVLRNATPFMVDGGIGLMPGIAVTLIGFPLAADKTVVGFQQSGLPLAAPGLVCWLSKAADEAIWVFSNCSGGAVTFGPPHRYLAGMHTGITWHEKGTDPRDIAPEAGPSGSGSGAPAAATAAGGELVVETDTWSGDSATGLAGQARACGGKRSRQEGRARDCDVQYCLNNVEHKSCMGTFVPAHVLVRLLHRCHELLAAAGDEDRGR